MTIGSGKNWQAIIDLISELKQCDKYNITTASIAMAYVCIDTLANLARPIEKEKTTRADFKQWVDEYLKAHPDQSYQYRGKDVYAARCAFLHTYGSEAELHEKDSDTIKFAYTDGGRHTYNPDIESGLVLIGTKSFINDVVYAVESFVKKCQSEPSLRDLVELRLNNVIQTKILK